ncbi:hypothetical protein KFL_003350060 [Klebsormidium nitens]|uniref:Transmembrane protein 135 N-terminal domain-containing protein n=1 Tax=Klebsormidium nitens TaxID=105231 RepID=A0A0U9HM67_KLENI|nr:hypothetical protein KFL_003350060 [Klebsormidium nitens]|eukprot:GAQ87156.1 hypothetical protein KFL_003350060 [Klebsormidium nitens]
MEPHVAETSGASELEHVHANHIGRMVDPSAVAKLKANIEKINSAASISRKYEQLQMNGADHLNEHVEKPVKEGRVASYNDLTRRHECDCEVELSDREIHLRALRRFVLAAIKGFVIGAGLKGGLALFGVLAKLQKRLRRRQKLEKGDLRTGLELGHAIQSTWRYGLFLGSFAGGFTAVDEIVAYIWGHKRTARWRALIGGALAGPALLLTGSKERHTSMAIYILVRAAVLTVRCGLKSRRFGWLFTPFGWRHGDAFLMCLSSLQILSAWILYPSTLPRSYVNFLNKHGGKDVSIIENIRDLAHRRTPLRNLDAVRRAYASAGRGDVSLDASMAVPCSMLHPGQACGPHVLRFLWGAYRRALPVYIPVYLIPALVVHRQNLFRKPLPILSKVALGTARSSLFLSCFCAGAWLFTCTIHQAAGWCGPSTLRAGAFPAGLAVLLEKKSRRMELALYCVARALESFALCLAEWGCVPRAQIPKRLDVMLFSLATAVIMHCYAQERDVFRSKYLNVLDFVFGIPGVINSCGASDCPVAKDATSTAKAPPSSSADH